MQLFFIIIVSIGFVGAATMQRLNPINMVTLSLLIKGVGMNGLKIDIGIGCQSTKG